MNSYIRTVASSQLMMHSQEPFAYGRESPVEVLRYFWLDNMKLARSLLITFHDHRYSISPIHRQTESINIVYLAAHLLDGAARSQDNET